MCSRLCLSTSHDEIVSCFGVGATDGNARLRPHWNIGVGQILPVIRWDAYQQRRQLDPMRWGLVSAWAKNTMIVCSNIDVAGGESLIRNATRRCLVPVDNFYEWRFADKQPFAVALASRRIMTLAGVWDLRISPLGEWIKCFAILATEANSLLAPLCRRMPVIIGPEDRDSWLGKEPASADQVLAQLKPCAQEQLAIWPIDRRVSNVKNDDPSILKIVDTV